MCHRLVQTLFLLTAALAAVPAAGAPDSDAGADAERPRIGLVLSGGGARGAAHAGILKLLEEHRVPVDYVAGTSIGALVGGFYAAGMSPNEIIEWLEELDWQAAALDRPPRRALSFRRKQDDATYALRFQVGYRQRRFVLPAGLMSGQELGFRLRLQTLHAARWQHFDDYPIPFRAVASDIERGTAVVLEEGSLADALLASMAVPGVVAPVELDGRLLLDGGLVDNLPVEVVRAMGADIIIAVDIATPLASRDALHDMIGVSTQVIHMVGQESVRAAIASLDHRRDLLVMPDVSGIGSADFAAMGEAIERGLATEPVIAARLRELALDEHAWRAWLAGQRHDERVRPIIHFIEIDNPTPIDDRLILGRISQQPGGPLSVAGLRRDVDALYSIGEFDRVDFSVVERDGLAGLVISVTPNPLRPDYLQFGLNIQDDLGGGSAYNLLALHTRTHLNALHGEWRNTFQIGKTRRLATELFQPVTFRGDFFVNPGGELMRTTFDLFDAGGAQVAQYDFNRDSASLDVGWQWRNIGEVAFGAFRDDIDARPRIGDPALPRFGERLAGWQWHVVADQLDSWTFPADAWYLDLRGRHARGTFGGQRDFGRVEAFLMSAWTVTARDRLLWSVRTGARIGGELPLYEQFPLGGFLSVSGLHQDQLRGDYLFVTRLVWYRRLFDLPGALGDAFYAGLSHERGNVWNDRSDTSLGDLRRGAAAFIGADLVFGAVYLGIGRADGGDTSGYLFLQRSFN